MIEISIRFLNKKKEQRIFIEWWFDKLNEICFLILINLDYDWI